MSEYFAKITWFRGKNEKYVDNKYSRGHQWAFDGGSTISASSSPHIVPTPYSIESNVDPEEAFIASLSSCHMLFFLSIAAKRRFIVDRYQDNACGILEKNAAGKMSMTRVTLRPTIDFSAATQPSIGQIEKMHHQSHAQCFIANSVSTEIIIELGD